jgi:hypothetical protein
MSPLLPCADRTGNEELTARPIQIVTIGSPRFPSIIVVTKNKKTSINLPRKLVVARRAHLWKRRFLSQSPLEEESDYSRSSFNNDLSFSRSSGVFS